MINTKRANVIIAAVSVAVAGLAVTLIGGVQSNVASPLVGDESNLGVAGRNAPPILDVSRNPGAPGFPVGSAHAKSQGDDATRRGAEGIPLFTLEFGTVSFGGSAPDDGTIMVVGRDVVGTISNENHTIEVGPVPILIFASTGNGDSDDDGDVDLFDFEGFLACVSAPDVPYSDPSCWSFDMNRDGSVDWTDYALFQLIYTGG